MLQRFFDDIELLRDRCTDIPDDREMKEWSIRYTDPAVAGLWKTLPEYSGDADWGAYKAAVFKYYPGADEDRAYSQNDLDTLTGKWAREGIKTSADLGAYHRAFTTITNYLRSKNRMTETDVPREFWRGMDKGLKDRVKRRLEVKDPDHHPEDPWTFDKVLAAATFVLLGTVTMEEDGLSAIAGPPVKASTSTEDVKFIIPAMEAMMSTLITKLLPTANNSGTYASQSGNRGGSSWPNSSTYTYQNPGGPTPPGPNASWEERLCWYCGQLHARLPCALLKTYITAGKVEAQADGKITLPGGHFIPRGVPGRFYLQRVDNYYADRDEAKGQDSSSKQAQGFLLEISPEQSGETPGPEEFLKQMQGIDVSDIGAYMGAVQTLEHNLNLLKDKREAMATESLSRVTRSKGAELIAPSENPEKGTSRPRKERVDWQREEPPHPINRAGTPIPSNKELPAIPEESVIPVTSTVKKYKTPGYHPPVNPQPIPQKTLPLPASNKSGPVDGPAWKYSAPIENRTLAKKVYERSLDVPITLTQRELLALSPDVRACVKEATTSKRLPVYGPRNEALMYVAGDPVEAFLQTQKPGEKEDFVVAKESAALRAVVPRVNGELDVESILDPGCQVVCASEAVWNALGLPYDPTITITLQSANGGLDSSLGLMRDVPFDFGGITVLLQVHVVRDPAYDILLGRPFDVLTESVLKNFKNEDQHLTIQDPNSEAKVTLPTKPRGRPFFSMVKKAKKLLEGFHSSMN